MMNLTKTSQIFKIVVKISFLVVGLYYFMIFIAGPGSAALFRKLFPPKDTSNPIYGLLDPLEFVEKPINGQQPSFVLNTKNGRLPNDLPIKMTVYKYKPPKFSYLGGKNAQDDAQALGFKPEELITDLKGTIYKWRNITTGSTLEIDIQSREVNLQTSQNILAVNPTYESGTVTVENAKKYAKNLFTKLGRFEDGLYSSGYQNVKLGRFFGNRILETNNPRDAQIALVDLYRNIGDFKVLGPDPGQGLLRCFIKTYDDRDANQTPLNTPMIEAHFWEIDTKSTATYPLIDINDAWDAVKNGKGVIANVTPRTSNPFANYQAIRVEEILVDNISLAYYDNIKQQKYLQPIYVFEGKYTTRGTDGGSITLYFPAIKGQYINTKSLEKKEDQPAPVAPAVSESTAAAEPEATGQ